MAATVRFTCTALDNTGKQGILNKDDDGYYTVVLGALGVYNSAGQFYEHQEAVKLFEGSSSFQRRVKGGKLKGELGHPKFMPGMTEDQFVNRVMNIYEDNVACHYKEIWLDFDSVKDEQGKPVIAMLAKVKGSGPHGGHFEKSLDNKHENVCFSIRAFTDDYREHGITKRVLRQIITWDVVTEPGISVAEKYKSPKLECYVDRQISRSVIQRVAETKLPHGYAAEDAGIGLAKELVNTMGWNKPASATPAWTKW